MSQDSNIQNLNPSTGPNFKGELLEALKYLKTYSLRPVEHIRNVPDWSWKVLLVTAAITAVVFGAIGGLIKLKFTSVLAGAIVFPFGTLIIVGTLSGLMYYTALFIFNARLNIRKVATISFLACLPWIVAGPLVDMVPPLKPMAVLMSGFLGVVGFTENTQLAKRDVIRIVGALVSIFVVFWIYNMIQNYESSPNKKKLINQQTLDILEQEMQKQEMQNTD